MRGRSGWWWAATLSLCGAVFACSDDDGGPGGGAVSFAVYCDEYAAMACQVASDCDCLEGYSIELCEMFLRDECADEVEAPVNGGRMSYDAGYAGQCLQAQWQIAHDCDVDDADWPVACDLMLEGLVSAGAACDEDRECLPGLECYGVCTVMPGEGEVCLDYSCAEDHFCGADDLCHRYRGQGQPCPEGDYACDDNLYCDVRVETCQPYLGAGQDCAHDDYACGDDLYCSASSQTCRAYPTAGQSCADSGGYCADEHYCDAGALCQPQLPGGAGCTDHEQCLSWDCVDTLCEPEESGDCPF